jgi:hypothetical protein
MNTLRIGKTPVRKMREHLLAGTQLLLWSKAADELHRPEFYRGR